VNDTTRTVAANGKGAVKSTPPRIALTIAEAAAAIGVSDDFFREQVLPELKVVRRGRKRLIGVEELRRWVERSATKVLD
jgi:excisionase family DNA binding protein